MEQSCISKRVAFFQEGSTNLLQQTSGWGVKIGWSSASSSSNIDPRFPPPTPPKIPETAVTSTISRFDCSQFRSLLDPSGQNSNSEHYEFKLMKSDKDRLENELSTLANLNRFMFAPSQPVLPDPPRPLPPCKSPITFTSQTTVLTRDNIKKDHKTKRPFTIESLISDDRSINGSPEPEETTVLRADSQIPSYLSSQAPGYDSLVHPPYIPQPLLLGLMHPQIHHGWQSCDTVPAFRFSPTMRTI